MQTLHRCVAQLKSELDEMTARFGVAEQERNARLDVEDRRYSHECAKAEQLAKQVRTMLPKLAAAEAVV